MSDKPPAVATVLTWADVYERAASMPPGKVWGIPRGGQYVAALSGRAVESPEQADVIVDDIIDTGQTAREHSLQYNKPVWALVDKAANGADRELGWVVFPWEVGIEQGPEENVRRLLTFLGENPDREGLLDTPSRVTRSLREMTVGYAVDPGEVLATRFDAETYDEMVVVTDMPFWSLCEHHLLPFHGVAHVGYIPNERIVGLSKIPRLLECFARRLQVQERLTVEVAQALVAHLAPLGVGVVIRGQHTCMSMRGIKSQGWMTTSCLLGTFRSEPTVRDEFLSFVRNT